MRTLIVITIVGLLTACAADPERVEAVGAAEAERLGPPSKALSTFAAFEVAALVYSDGIKADDGKMEEATEFEGLYRSEIGQLFDGWTANPKEGSSGTLVLEGTLTGLRVVSGGARFWVGAMAGDSFIDMDLRLVDKSTGEELVRHRVYRDADSMTGAWSVGKSDQNLDQYIVEIVRQYLVNNY
jgi:hypothetical protein